MTLYMLDTDIVSYAMSGRSYPRLLAQLKAHVNDLVISSITYKELVFGCENGGNPQKCHDRLALIIKGFDILPFDDKAAYRAGLVELTLKRAGTPIGQMDTMIAAHALSLDAVLVSNNQKHHGRVEDLQLENWL